MCVLVVSLCRLASGTGGLRGLGLNSPPAEWLSNALALSVMDAGPQGNELVQIFRETDVTSPWSAVVIWKCFLQYIYKGDLSTVKWTWAMAQ